MKHACAAGIVVVLLTFSASLALAPRSEGRAYTAGQVQAGILQHPDRWLGRTVLVRGVVAGEGLLVLAAPAVGSARRYTIGGSPGSQPLSWSAQATPIDLAQPVAPDPRAPLVVDQERAGDGWFGALVGRLPLLGRLLPARAADGRRVATYRIVLTDASARPGCAARVCYHADLQGPAPTL